VKHPRIYADFQNADSQGRLRLNCVGTTKDLARQKVSLSEGLVLTLYSDDADREGNADDLEVEAKVEYSDSEQCWVAHIDWDNIRHASETQPVNSRTAPSTIPGDHG
jgi:hypothetical protein